MDANRYRARQLRNAATDAERRLWQYLRQKQLGGFRFRRQVPMAGYIADFVCPEMKLIVELDGGQHLQQIECDARRTKVLAARGYKLLRYWNDDALLRTGNVLEDILRNLLEVESNGKSTPPRPSPSPAAKGRGKSKGDAE